MRKTDSILTVAAIAGLIASGKFAIGEDAAKPASNAQLPLHERIDRMIESGKEGKLAAIATDAEFVRRAYLDLWGVVPSSSEARDFLDDPSPYKRERLIDKLLAGSPFVYRMATVFDVALMERRDMRRVRDAEWIAFLRDSFAANKPYDQLVREILSADGNEPTTKGEAKFLLERGGDPTTLVRDIGRMFLGRDIQCSQCHDHPLVDDYKQAHYQGLYAFFSRTYAIAPEGNQIKIGEKAEGEVEYKSVFKRKVTHKTGPRVLDLPEIADVPQGKNDEYWRAPIDNQPAVPKYSRRARLAQSITSKDNVAFRRNGANRLWALMMGRGLVHPVDWDHSDNPPSQPELLNMLGDEFAAMGYDIKALLRELALTRTYQRSSEPPPGVSEGDLGPETFALAALKPLSPEQLCMSMMRATGVLEAREAEAHRTLIATDPKFAAIASIGPAFQRMAEFEERARLHQSIAGDLNAFITAFAAAAGQSQDKAEATVHQALFLANGYPLNGWLAPSGANLTGRLAAIGDNEKAAEELYLGVLGRRPTADERALVVKYLDGRKADRPKAMQEMAWGLITSVEFRFNH